MVLYGWYKRCFSRLTLLSSAVGIIFYIITFENNPPLLPFRYSLNGYTFPRLSDTLVSRELPTFSYTKASNGTLFLTTAFTRCHGSKLLTTVWERYYNNNSKYIACLRHKNGTLAITDKVEKLRFYSSAKLRIVNLAFEVQDMNEDFITTVVKIPPKYSGKDDKIPENMSVIQYRDLFKYCPSDDTGYISPQKPLVPKFYMEFTETHETKIDQNCLNDKQRRPSVGKGEPTSIAICAKIAFDKLDAHLVIEWVEYNIKMGVSMIVVYIYNLNEAARKVFRHYEEKGYMVVLTFDFPMKDKIKRNVGQKSRQSWNDEQAALNDCHERLRLFKYVIVIDFDEFLVPVKEDSYASLIKNLLTKYMNASAFVFTMHFHITDWTDENNNGILVNKQIRAANISDVRTISNDTFLLPRLKKITNLEESKSNARVLSSSRMRSLYAKRFLQRTDALWRNMKMLLVMGRSHFWAPWTHTIPKLLPQYRRVIVRPIIASIHHFRKCRRQWKNNTCFTIKRVKDDRIMRLFDKKLQDIIAVKKKLLLG